jgi:CheY-like chemotaxis protein
MPLSLLIYVESVSDRDFMRNAVRCRTPFHRVSEAGSAEEASRQIRESHFDVAVVDLDAEAGGEVLRALRQDTLHRHIPILGLSYDTEGRKVERLLTGTLDSLVSKPVETSVLIEELAHIVGTTTESIRP